MLGTETQNLLIWLRAGLQNRCYEGEQHQYRIMHGSEGSVIQYGFINAHLAITDPLV